MDFSVKDTSKVIRDCRQITLVTLNGFCLLSKAPSHHPYPLFLKGNIKLDGIPSKTTWKTYTFFILYLKFWSYFLSKVTSHSYQLFYILLFYFNFYISRYIFYNILEVYSTLSKKSRIFLFIGFTKTHPTPLTAKIRWKRDENVLSMLSYYNKPGELWSNLLEIQSFSIYN